MKRGPGWLIKNNLQIKTVDSNGTRIVGVEGESTVNLTPTTALGFVFVWYKFVIL